MGAAIRYGIEGMREGGRRSFSASPVLTACDRRLRYEVELLEVRDRPWQYRVKQIAEILPVGNYWRSGFCAIRST